MKEFKDLNYQKLRRAGNELLKHLNEFSLDLKLSVGMWYFSPFPSRFHEPFQDKCSMDACIEKISELKKFGVEGIEAHYPYEINEDNAEKYIEIREKTGIEIYQIGAPLFYDKEFEFGSLSSPVKPSREKAVNLLIKTLKFSKEVGANHVGIWPGLEGYTYPLGNFYYMMWDLFEDSVALALDEVEGIRIAIEPKPYEPIPNNIYRTTSDGIIACSDIESRLKSQFNKSALEKNIIVGMQPEIGHIRMGYEDTPYAFSRSAREGRLIHTHWNSQPLGNYDLDLNVGVVEWQQAEAALYALKIIGYKEFFGIDINPERMPVEKAIEINWKVLNIMNERINNLPHEDILECYLNPDKNRGALELIYASSFKI